jgi:hypothetical protein
VRRHLVGAIACLAFTGFLGLGGTAQQPRSEASPKQAPPHMAITIDGKAIAADDVLVRKNKTYLSLAALASVLDTTVEQHGYTISLEVPALEGNEKDWGDVTQLSANFRKAAVGIPDAIESLRPEASKAEAIIPSIRFDAIDRQILEANYRVATKTDKSISVALSHAADELAITYYRLHRGLPPESVREDQLDSVLCTMESKFALLKGRLS